jgi:hypothetical protein
LVLEEQAARAALQFECSVERTFVSLELSQGGEPDKMAMRLAQEPWYGRQIWAQSAAIRRND